MNPLWNIVGRKGFDVARATVLRTPGTGPGPLDWPDAARCIFNHILISFMQDLVMNAEALFGQKCVGLGAKLEIQARDSQSHHIMWLVWDKVIKDGHEIDSMVSAELLTEQKDPDHRSLVKKINIHRHSQYFVGPF